MLSSISSSVSGIKAAFGMLGVSARNTALMDADGYKKETVKLAEGKNGEVVVTLGRDLSPGPLYQSNGKLVEASNVNYADEAVSHKLQVSSKSECRGLQDRSKDGRGAPRYKSMKSL